MEHGRMADWKEKKVRLTHYEVDPVNGPGQMVTRPFNLAGNPFAVFCSNEECEHFIDRPSALPWWSEDCSEQLGVLRCGACGSPVIRPRKPD